MRERSHARMTAQCVSVHVGCDCPGACSRQANGEGNKPSVEREKDEFDVTIPIHDSSAKIIATAGMDFQAAAWPYQAVGSGRGTKDRNGVGEEVLFPGRSLPSRELIVIYTTEEPSSIEDVDAGNEKGISVLQRSKGSSRYVDLPRNASDKCSSPTRGAGRLGDRRPASNTSLDFRRQ